MTTSIQVDDGTVTRLEELEAEIKRETGRKVTQQELLETIVDHAFTSKADIFEMFRGDGDWDGLSPEEIERWLSGTVASGSGIDEDDIDESLYGSEIE